jgi:hypothetical protein
MQNNRLRCNHLSSIPCLRTETIPSRKIYMRGLQATLGTKGTGLSFLLFVLSYFRLSMLTNDSDNLSDRERDPFFALITPHKTLLSELPTSTMSGNDGNRSSFIHYSPNHDHMTIGLCSTIRSMLFAESLCALGVLKE